MYVHLGMVSGLYSPCGCSLLLNTCQESLARVRRCIEDCVVAHLELLETLDS
jgi:hypothetical protein